MMPIFHLTQWLAGHYPLLLPVCHCHSQSQAVVTSRTSSSSSFTSTSSSSSSTSSSFFSFSTSSSSSKLLPHQAIDPTLSGPQSQGSQVEFKPYSALKTRPPDLTRIEFCGKSCLKFSRTRFTMEVASNHSSN